MDYLKDHPDITLVRFVLFDSGTYRAYEEALQELEIQDSEEMG
jgi:O-acetyl-ADP-ribose deacetylase (regulator of RNase III)